MICCGSRGDKDGGGKQRRATFRLLLTAMLVCFGMLGCKSYDTSDVTGTWVVTAESRQRFLSASQQKALAKIVLQTNRRFIASEVSEDLLYGPPESEAGLVTGSGVWKLASSEGKQQVQLEFRAITVGQRGSLMARSSIFPADGRR